MDMRERDLEDLFYKFGKIQDVQVKIPHRPPAFGFVTFGDSRDADDAIKDMDGTSYDGEKIRVELVKGGRRDRGRGPPPRKDLDRCGGYTDYRVFVTGLPPSASWQDVKDHFRQAGDVRFADVDRSGAAVVEFGNRSDLEYALDRLDRSNFKNPFDESRIKVREDRRRGRSRSGGRRRRRTPSRSRSRSHRRSSRDRKRSESRHSRNGRDSGDRKDSRDRADGSKDRSQSRDRRSRDRSASKGRDSPERRESPARDGSRGRSAERDGSPSPRRDRAEDEN